MHKSLKKKVIISRLTVHRFVICLCLIKRDTTLVTEPGSYLLILFFNRYLINAFQMFDYVNTRNQSYMNIHTVFASAYGFYFKNVFLYRWIYILRSKIPTDWLIMMEIIEFDFCYRTLIFGTPKNWNGWS